MATVTADKAQTGVSPRFLHEGVVHEFAVYSASITLNAADVVEMLRAPKGATIHDVLMTTGNVLGKGTGDVGLAVGDGVNAERFLSHDGSNSVTTILRMSREPGYQYSVEDTIDITIENVATGTATGDKTASGIIMLSVVYSCDKEKTDAIAGGTTAGG